MSNYITPKTWVNWELILATAIVALIVIVVEGKAFLMAWAGDAVIHLRIAELCAQNRFFEFNVGETTVGTTSLLWTIVLTLFFKFFDPSTVPHAVKLLNFGAWFLSLVLMIELWGNLFQSRAAGIIGAILFALSPGFLQNSFNGMEAILSAFLHLLLFRTLIVAEPSRTRNLLLGFSAVATALVRPEGILFCFLLGILWFRANPSNRIDSLLLGLGSLAGVTAISAINYYLSENFVPDSGIARIAAALRESWFLGKFHIHPKSLKLFLAYFPVTFGLILSSYFLLKKKLASLIDCKNNHSINPTNTGSLPLHNNLEQLAFGISFSVLLTITMFVMYSFILGSVHNARYWIPFYPFIMGTAGGTLFQWIRILYYEISTRKYAWLLVFFFIIWMFVVYKYEFRARIAQGIGYNHNEIVSAVCNREKFTQRFLEEIGATSEEFPIIFAATEVQIRYFLQDDQRLRIFSLDGRTSRNFARYLDTKTGLRRFDLLLKEVRPHYIELGQFLPNEPILPEVEQKIALGQKTDIILGEFCFRPTKIPNIVKCLYNIKSPHNK